jgi:elongator complex protein 3
MDFDDIVLREIIKKLIGTKQITRSKAIQIAKSICKKHSSSDIPTNVQLLQACSEEEKVRLKQVLKTKPIRTASGVTVITAVAKPAKCPGSCIYCPKGKNAPQSYTGLEPAVQRGIKNLYDPYKQVMVRLKQYNLMAHPTDKVELIIIGGTFLALEKKYQEWFVLRMFDALNGRTSKTLKDAHRLNENASIRCTGLTIETRADYCFASHINQMLKLGTTRVEIGLQSIYPEVLKKISRMHTVEDVIKATQLAKDSGLKCTYHIMPGLFVDKKRDLEQFKFLFKNPSFRPDSLKIYPALVIKGTKLYDMWKNGDYVPLSNDEATELLAKAMRYIPEYCRIIRVQRDIPSNEIEAGVKKSNLRELVEKKSESMQIRIKEIRYREVGHKKTKVSYDNVKLYEKIYDASDGKEIFLSFEDRKSDTLIAFLRLRIPFKPFRPEIDKKAAIVRELHVYGSMVPVGEFKSEAWQHKGFGRQLLEKAEKTARDEFGKKKIVVISGVGMRSYYYQFGYKLEGPYVSKALV